MLKKIAKWIVYVLGTITCLVLVFYLVVYIKTQGRIDKTYQVNIKPLAIPEDSVSYARGKIIATNRGCLGCHGIDLGGGRAFIDENTPVGVIYAANITSGKGGIVFNDTDWIKVLRHGLDKNNKSVWLMPSQDIYEISNQDMRDLINYVKNALPVDRVVPGKSIKPLGRVLLFADKFPFLSAELINHNAEIPDVVKPAETAEYGHYLATVCQGCHGPKFTGAESHEPGGVPAPNITATGEVGKWAADDFLTIFHKGVTPQGRTLDKGMPWDKFSYTDTDLKALYLYFKSLK